MSKLRKGDRELIKDINRSFVINVLRKKGPVSRTELAQLTGLGQSTMTKIVEELKTSDLVNEVGAAISTGGRKAILLEFNQRYGFAIGVKIMQDHIVIALTDLNAEMVDEDELPFDDSREVNVVIELIVSGIKNIIQKQKINMQQVVGIGIAVSGLINSSEGTVLRSSLLGWNQVNLKKELNRHFDIPIYVDNDVNAYTYAEIQKGYGLGHRNFICISVGDGIGAGIVINQQIYKGDFGGAGEFGHTVIDINGPGCHCGQKGCLEAIASTKALEKKVKSLLPEYPKTILKNKKIKIEDICIAAKQGDPLGVVVLEHFINHISIGLINAINSFNPASIVLIGEAMVASEDFVPQIVQKAEENFFSKASYKTSIVTSKLGNSAWVQGAALLAIDQLFQPPIYEEAVSLLN